MLVNSSCSTTLWDRKYLFISSSIFQKYHHISIVAGMTTEGCYPRTTAASLLAADAASASQNFCTDCQEPSQGSLFMSLSSFLGSSSDCGVSLAKTHFQCNVLFMDESIPDDWQHIWECVGEQGSRMLRMGQSYKWYKQSCVFLMEMRMHSNIMGVIQANTDAADAPTFALVLDLVLAAFECLPLPMRTIGRGLLAAQCTSKRSAVRANGYRERWKERRHI